MTSTRAIIEALRARRIRALRAAADPAWQGVQLGMSVSHLERFLDIIIRHPITEEDRLAMRVFARATELAVTDEPWQYRLLPGISEGEFVEMRAYVNIPDDDVAEVLARLSEAG